MTAKKPMKIVSVLLAFLVALSGSFVFSVAASHYSADHPEAVDSSLGRKELHSFFVNGQTDPNYPFPGFWQPDYLDDADNVNQFVSKVRSALNSNYSACRADFFPPNRNETADNWPSCFRRKALAMHAAFIVHTMLGDTASDWQAVCGGGATCYRAVEHPSEGARARFSQWEAHVRYYDSQGWADFNYMYTVQCEASWNSAHWGRDVSWINNGCGTSATYETIRFQRGPGDDPYTIVKFCGNTKGPVGSLRPPPDPVSFAATIAARLTVKLNPAGI
ncbi:MAG: hypothetical protein U5L95_05585 [Candidatus Saccharibacteria bacterium]|nr:hypothetical protein [Candidatus Saccharibacteria bacterium]